MKIFRIASHLCIAAAILLTLPTHASDLLTVWTSAQERDPGFRAALTQQAVGEAQREQAQSLWNPSVFVSAFGGAASNYSSTREAYFRTPGSTSDDVRFNTSVYLGAAAQASITALKPLFDKTREASARQLGLAAEISDLGKQIARQHLARSVVERYVDVVIAQEALQLHEAHEEAVRRADNELRKRRALRDVSQMDVHESAQRLSMLAAQKVRLQTELEIARLALKDLSGVDSLPPRMQRSASVLSPLNLQKIVANLALGHPELRAYDLQHQIAQYEAQKFYLGTRSAKVDFIAQASADVLSGPGDYGSSAGLLGADQRVGVQITMPLSTGGLNVAKQREALAIAEKALADRARAALALEQQARAAWQMLNSFPASISALESALTSARQRLLETRKAHANGARSTLELLAAEAAVVDAEKQLILEQANHARSWARLQAAAGVMEDKDFHKIQSVLRNKPWAN